MIESFHHALNGFLWLVANQRNFKIHLLVSFLVLFFAFVLKVTRTEFLILIFCIILGLIVETVNTAFEEVCDLVTVKWAKQAKVAKDVSSAMMLFTSFGLSVIGLLIFIPYFL